jgi:hypothetical protein
MGVNWTDRAADTFVAAASRVFPGSREVALPGQLQFDLEPDDLADLDMERAEEILAAEQEAEPPPPVVCRCDEAPLIWKPLPGDEQRCGRCGRAVA